MTTPPQQANLTIQLPDDMVAGVYSNVAAVWHTAYEFTIDFAVMQPAQPAQIEDGTTRIEVPCRVVSRVKLPPSVVFDLMRALSVNEQSYEQNIGPIRKPGRQDGTEPSIPPKE